MNIFDRRAVRLHRDRAASTLGAVAPVLREAADRLLDRLDDITRVFPLALDIGGRGIVAPLLRERGIETVSCDLSARMAALSGGVAAVADEECLPFAAETFELVVANLSLHWINDLPGALIQIRRILKPDGLFLASFPVLGTLAELRAALLAAEEATRGGASPRVSPFPELRDCAGLLQRAGFSLPVADVEDISLLYANPLMLLRDLRAAGESNAIERRDRGFPPRAMFPAALAALPTVSEHGQERARATLRLAVMTGWSPGPTQPKPAERGSGRRPLGELLGPD